MPYSQVYKARYLDGSVGYLSQASNVFVPGSSNVLMNSPTYIGGVDNIDVATTNLNFVNMNFTSPSVIRASNLLLTSNITGSNLFSYTNAISCANINFINYLGTLQPYANTMTTGNLIVRGTITAQNFRGSTWLLGNLSSQTNTFALSLTGSINTFANSILVTTVGARDYTGSSLTASNVSASNIVAGTLILNTLVGSNAIQTDGTLTAVQLIGGRLTGNLIGTVRASNLVGNYTPFANTVSAQTVTAVTFIGGTLTSGTNLISSSSIVGGNLLGAVNTYTNIVSSTSTLRAGTFIGGFTTTGNITTTGTVTGTKLIGGIIGANTLTSNTVMTAGALTGGIRAFANSVTCSASLTGQQFIGALDTYANSIAVNNVWAGSITAVSLNGSIVRASNIVTANLVGPVVAYANTVQTGALATSQNFIGDISLTGPLVTQNPLTANSLVGAITAYANNINIDQSLYSGTLTGAIIGSNVLVTTGTIQAGSLYGGITSTNYVRTDTNLSCAQLVGGLVGSNTITISGNVFTATANFQGNVIATNVITSTLVVGSLAGNIRSYRNNISTTSFIVASNIQGQILSYSNTISTQANLSYGTDLSKAGVFYRPGVSNALVINQSLTHLMSNSYGRQLAWTASSNNTSVSYYSTNGLTGWYGGVLLPDGRVCLVPDTANSIGIFNTQTNTFSNVTPGGDGISSLGGGWRGGVLMPDSNVVFLPYSNAFLCMYDPITNILSKRQSPSPGRYLGGCLLPNGNVLCIPNLLGSSLHEIDPYAAVGTETKFIGVGTGSFAGCVLRPDGKVLLVPESDVFTYVYDYSTDILNSLVSVPGLLTGPDYYTGGVYLPTGRAFLIPKISLFASYVSGTTPTLGPIMPTSLSWGCVAANGKVVLAATGASIIVFDIYSELFYSVACNIGYAAPVATPSGRVVFSPQTATGGVMVMNLHGQIPPNVALSPYYNKI